MSRTITRKLVRGPIELIFSDGRRWATQRWVETCSDVREIKDLGPVEFGWIRFGPSFPTADSVPGPHYRPPETPTPSRLKRLFSWARRTPPER